MGLDAPWVTRPLGALPSSLQERARVLLRALADLPRTAREDQLSELAASISFFGLFSAVPALVVLVTLLPWLPGAAEAEAQLTALLSDAAPLMPTEVHTLLERHLTELLTQRQGGLATISAVISLYSGSRALVSLSRAFNRCLRVPTIESEFLRRLRSMGLTMTLMTALLATVLALGMGGHILDWLVGHRLLPRGTGNWLIWARWPFLGLVAAVLVQQLYHLLPDGKRPWILLSTGSVLSVLTWVVGTWLFTLAATGFLRANVAYGSLGSVVVVMAWMYVSAYALMLGAEINSLMARGLPTDAPPPRRHDGPERRGRPRLPPAKDEP